MIAVRFFLEITGVGRTLDLGAHRTSEFPDNPEILVPPHISRRHPISLALQWLGLQLHLKCRFGDRQQQLAIGRPDWSRSLFIRSQHVDDRLLLVVVNCELDVILTTSPVGEGSFMRPCPVATMSMVSTFMFVAMISF
jgi:hypothetical protein